MHQLGCVALTGALTPLHQLGAHFLSGSRRKPLLSFKLLELSAGFAEKYD